MCLRVCCTWATRPRRFIHCLILGIDDSADVADSCGLVGAGGALVRAGGQGRGHGRVARAAPVEARQGDAQVWRVPLGLFVIFGRSPIVAMAGPMRRAEAELLFGEWSRGIHSI